MLKFLGDGKFVLLKPVELFGLVYKFNFYVLPNFTGLALVFS